MRNPKGEARPDQPVRLIFDQTETASDVDLEERTQQNRRSA